MSQVADYAVSTEPLADVSEQVEEYAPLVKRIAYHLMSRLPPSVQVDDLIQAGMIGLLEAARHYDPNQGASFETYAGIRIRGSMLDEIRKGDWAPRSLHRKVREVESAVRKLEVNLGRDARDSEIAEELDLTLDEYYRILQDASYQRVFSLEGLGPGDDAGYQPRDEISDGPLAALERGDTKKVLTAAIKTLPERERLVLALYYDEELNLREIGAILGVSESRVCQIHTQTLIRLKARMTEWHEI